MKKEANKNIRIVAYASAVLVLSGALGHFLAAVTAVTNYFAGLNPETYWLNRLRADELIEGSCLLFSGLALLVAAKIITSPSQEIRKIAREICWLALIPTSAVIIFKLYFTPGDIGHALPFLLAIVGISFVLIKSRK